jgi:hypothetical protein
MSNSTNTVVFFDWKTVIYIYVSGQCRTQFMLLNSNRRYLINMNFYDGKISHMYFYDRASVTITLCLQALIPRRILLILDMLIIFSEYIYV